MQPKNNKNVQLLAKYSGLAFSMMGIIALGVFLGHLTDDYFEIEGAYGTLIFTIIFVFLSLFYVLKDFIVKK